METRIIDDLLDKLENMVDSVDEKEKPILLLDVSNMVSSIFIDLTNSGIMSVDQMGKAMSRIIDIEYNMSNLLADNWNNLGGV